MIGLGSNRLSVCRRGGMSVTQAGRGGMEWLAGGRLPSWAQWWLPYSRQAGEALKAQFPTQWPTIWDYGFAHPEIVPYVNANYLIAPYVCGCIEPDYNYPIRGIAPLNTGYIATNKTSMDVRFYYPTAWTSSTANYAEFISAGNWPTTNGIYVYAYQCGQNVVMSAQNQRSQNVTVGNIYQKNCRVQVNQNNITFSTDSGVSKTWNTAGNWYGNQIVLLHPGSAVALQYYSLSIKEDGAEVRRYYMLADKLAWEVLTGTLVDNR